MRTGYQAEFLGPRVHLPTSASPTTALDYVHYSVAFRPDRRLACISAVNIDGNRLLEIERTKDVWLLDPRVPAAQQLDNAIYDHNDFDRGHLTRRRDPGWGTAAEAKAANDDTFHYTNAAPQVAVFNQSKDLWAGLEDYILVHAATYQQRLSVFTGPVLLPADPVYRAAQIPLRFFKVAAWLDEAGRIAAAGYVLDQTDLVAVVIAAPDRRSRAAPPLGAYKTYQVPIADIAALAGLAMPDLNAADVLEPAVAAAPMTSPTTRWLQLADYEDTVLS